MTGTKIDFARDDAIGRRADELMKSDPELKIIAKSSSMTAFRLAIGRAIKETQPTAETDTSADAAAGRDEAINTKAQVLLNTDPQLVQLARTDRAEAFKRAIRKAVAEIAAGSGSPNSGAPAVPVTFARERRQHEVARAMLTSDPDLKALAERNYPAALERAHSAADSHYLVKERAPATTVKPGSREEKVHRLALALLTEPWLMELDRSDPGKAFDQAMAEAVIHYPVNADGTEGEPTRFARAAEMSWLTSTPLPSDLLRDERARAAIERQRHAGERSVEARVVALETGQRRTGVHEVPVLQPGEPRLVTLTRGPDGRIQRSWT